MSTGLLDSSMGEAEAAMKSEQSYQASKSEKALNAIGSKMLAVSGSSEVSMAQNAMASAEFSVLKDQVSNFAENTKILVSVLDDLGKMHPFIQAAVVIFKAGIQLELTRRENDQKVLALNVTMCDMMSVLKILKKVGSPNEKAPDGTSIEERLRGRMEQIIVSIKSCAKLCDSYQRRHAAVKFFTSSKWQSKFAGVAEQFVTHQNDIQNALQMYVSVEITNTNVMLSALNKNVNTMMEMVFERMQSPEEREIARIAKTSTFIQTKDGVNVTPDDKLLKEIIKSQPSAQKKDDKAPSKGSQQPILSIDLATLKKEMNKDVDTVLAENSQVFDRAFEATEIRLREVKGTIIREGDRVISTILAGVNRGPQDRIVDRDIYHIWQEMGWRGSVNATYFVMALQEHFSSKSNVALNEIQTIANNSNPTSAVQNLKDIASIAEEAIPATPAKDLWSLQYINIQRAQPLIEALDDDGSSFITVNEVNAFTTSRPEGWSLPRWIAYWTIGFEMTTQWYYRRIRQLLIRLSGLARTVLPANRNVTCRFMMSWSIAAIQRALSGLQNVNSWDNIDWKNYHVFHKFEGWALTSEKKMDEVLRTLVYYIDQDNTLNTVTGGGRPERYMMPLFYLLLKRSHWIMERAHDVVLHPQELNMINASLITIQNAAQDRVTRLQSIYKLQNINTEEKLQSIFFGLYTYTFGNTTIGDFWTKDLDYEVIDDESPSSTGIPEPDLYFGPQNEELDFYSEPTNDAPDPLGRVVSGDQEGPMSAPQETQSLVGAWSGTDGYRSAGSTDGLVSFSITQHTPDDRFQSSGVDTRGPFSVHGRITGGRVLFLKEYAELQSGGKVSRRYDGLLNEAQDEISGNWGWPLGDEEEAVLLADEKGDDVKLESKEEANSDRVAVVDRAVDNAAPVINIELATPKDEPDEEDATGGDTLSEAGSAVTSAGPDTTEPWGQGTFTLSRRPADYALCRPSDEEFQTNKQRALWTLVRNAAKYWYRTRHLTWEGIKERRDKRRIYLELLRKRSEGDGTFGDAADGTKWAELVRTLHPNDLHLWHHIAQFENRRDPVHSDVHCDNCRNDLQSTRLLCIECSTGETYNTLDLCPTCQNASLYRKDGEKNHTSSHRLLQFRRNPLEMVVNPFISDAKDLLENLSDEDVKHCTACSRELSERPYWCCFTCEDHIFICIQCNDRAEKEKPWRRQRKLEVPHDPFHSMVLHTNKVENNVVELSTNERLGKLDEQLGKLNERLAKSEEKLDVSLVKQETSFVERLQKLEEKLDRVIAAVTQVP